MHAVPVTAAVERRDRRVEGAGLLTLGPGGWELVVQRAGCDPWREEGAYDDVRALERDGAAGLTLALAHAGRVRLAFASEAESHEAERLLAARCCALPELTRALRSLGAGGPWSASGRPDADRFFEPLLLARRRAAEGADGAEGGGDAVARALGAFDGAALAAALERMAAEFAAARHPERASARRALEARLCDRLEPLLDALARLDEAAAPLRAEARGAPRVGAWREWVSRLQRVFERADECWPHLAAELAPGGTQVASALPRASRNR